MDTGKKVNLKDWVLPAVLVVLLVLTVILHQRAYSQDKESLGTKVHVRVTEVKTGASKLNPGGLKVTVSYQGEAHRLHGVPSSAHFVMKNSKNYRSTVGAILYDGKLYYDYTSIHLLADKLYYAALAATFLVFVLIFGQLKEKMQG